MQCEYIQTFKEIKMPMLRWSLQDLIEVIEGCILDKFDCVIFCEGNRGLGKTLCKGSKVLMSDGSWKNVEDIEIGDEVISPQQDGSFAFEKVVHLHNRFETNIYEIRELTRKKRLLYTCAGNHDVPILRISHPRKKENGIYNGKRDSKQILDCYDAQKLAKMYNKSSHICSFTTTAIDFKQNESSIEPYCLGVWLGDGYKYRFHVGDKKRKCMDYFIKKGYLYDCPNHEIKNKYYSIPKNCDFAKDLIKFNLLDKKSGTKFIPKECLLSSINYRFKLLAGLIDSDGYVMEKKDNHISITTKSKQLSEDIKDLVFSLGGYSIIKKIKKKCQNDFEGEYYNVKVSFKNPKEIPLITDKKKRLGGIMKHDPRHIAIEVKKRESGKMVYGFSITGKSKWHITDNWMITHNSTLMYKLGLRLHARGIASFRPRNNMVFSREDTLKLLAKQKANYILSDELINVAYNRDFYEEEQKVLLKALNMYRDSCNVFAGCVPKFNDLDTQIKKLCKIRITIIRRGVALIHTQIKGIYRTDPWDSRENMKIEVGRQKKRRAGSTMKWGKLSTVKGVLSFSDLTPKQRDLYERLKQKKRGQVYAKYEDTKEEDDAQKGYRYLVSRLKNLNLTKDELVSVCELTNKNYRTVLGNVNKLLREEGNPNSVSYFFQQTIIRRKEEQGKKLAKTKYKVLSITSPIVRESPSTSIPQQATPNNPTPSSDTNLFQLSGGSTN